MPALSPAALRIVQQIRLARQLGIAAPRRKKVPAQQQPSAIARDYAAELLRLVDRTQEALAPLLAELPELLASAARARSDSDETRYDAAVPTCHWCRGKGHVDVVDAVRVGDIPQDFCACRLLWRLDAGEGKRVRDLMNQAQTALAAGLQQPRLEELATRFANETQTYQRLQFLKQTKAGLGIDIRLADPRLPAIIDGFAAENVALIKDIPARIMRDVELATTRAMTSGKLWPQLAKELEAKFGYGRTRAKLIARDQVGKLYGQVNAERQQEIGVQRFKWRTVHDPRVRPEHFDLDNKIFSYEKPPSVGLPGEPVNCRCWADPQFDEILAAIDADDDEAPPAPPIIPVEPPSLLPAFQARVQPITAARGRPRASGEELQAAVSAVVAKTGTFTGSDVTALAKQLGHSTHKIHEMLAEAAARATAQNLVAQVAAQQAAAAQAQAQAQAAAEAAARAVAQTSTTKRDTLRDQALAKLAGRKWKAARDVMETELDELGLTRMPATKPLLWAAREQRAARLGITNLPAMPALKRPVKLNARLSAYGTHSGFDDTITLHSDVAARASLFAEAWAADPAKVRAQLVRVGVIQELTAAGQVTATTITAADIEAIKVAQRLKSTRTVMHETLHGYGPRTPLRESYVDHGKLVEEMTTEFAARNWIRTRFDVPSSLLDRTAEPLSVGGYEGWCVRMIDTVQAEGGLTRQAAVEALESAAIAYKKLPTGTVNNADEALDAWVTLLPGDPTSYRAKFKLIARMGSFL